MTEEMREFEKMHEVAHSPPVTKRPEEISIEGERILEKEKTPMQKEVLGRAIGLLKKRMEELGLSVPEVDPRRVVFHMPLPILAAYTPIDVTFIRPDTEANLSAVTHELTHSVSSEWSVKGVEATEQALAAGVRDPKSGFHSVWHHDRQNPDSATTNFKVLNEGITEKIARELIAEAPHELEELKSIFGDEAEERRKSFLEQYRIGYEQRMKHLESGYEERIRNLNLKGDEEDIRGLLENFEKSSFELLRDIEKNLYESYQRTLETNYSFRPVTDYYGTEVELVDVILAGLIKAMVAQDVSLTEEEVHTSAWQDMQRAYFHGNTMYLRRIEDVFGKGTLKDMSNLSPTDDQAKKLFIEELRTKI